MRLERSPRSENIEDYRSRPPASPRGPGAGLKFGIGTIVMLVVAYFLGIDPRLILGLSQAVQQTALAAAEPAPIGAPSDAAGEFVARVLGDTEQTWGQLFAAGGALYEPPRLVLFSSAVQSACGFASAAAGPFYCPADRKVYIDLAFFRELDRQFGAPGDFAQAYVIAHEVGHHVQTLLGTSAQVRAAQQRVSQAEANRYQVAMELQADCYAGLWAHHAQRSRQILEAGDLEEGLAAASAVGDDTIQRRMQGYVVPESFTHGSAQQRMAWFRRGLESGTLEACDTFGAL
ncbi:MAG: zinc metallopeptidase [Steroidobacteraceae bacterium]|nr:zinc metallopeptidase [Steroidobacteraceae bacterium]MDW8258894.1 neutral zinc metallopeptidase [Gammaproteobacteria bacterium]